MPWTFAHPAVVLPLQRLGLPLSALVAGSIAPDVPSYVPGLSIREWTHSWLGVVTIDLVLALGVFALWTSWRRSQPTTREWQLAVPAVVIGSLTHVVWDAATHPDQWITNRVDWLREQHGPLLGHEWAQLISTVVGGLVVLAYLIWRRIGCQQVTSIRRD